MNKALGIAAFTAITAALAGCANAPSASSVPENRVRFLVNSVPQGATLEAEGRVVGVTPTYLVAGPITPANRAEKRFTSTPVTFKWRSGTQITQSLVATWTVESSSYTGSSTVTRPVSEGLANDEAYAASLLQQRQANAAANQGKQDARLADSAGSFVGALVGVGIGAAASYQGAKSEAAAASPRESSASPVTCRTREVGYQLITRCE